MKLKIYYQENQQINTKTIGIDELYNLPKNIIDIVFKGCTKDCDSC